VTRVISIVAMMKQAMMKQAMMKQAKDLQKADVFDCYQIKQNCNFNYSIFRNRVNQIGIGTKETRKNINNTI
jgi:hypothetical protein